MPNLMMHHHPLRFDREVIRANFMDLTGRSVEKKIEVRTNPITRRTCRITLSRNDEKEAGTDTLPSPPPDAFKSEDCPFCSRHVFSKTPQLQPGIFSHDRLIVNDSVLFPNLFPYGGFSAVSLFDDTHFVEIGSAKASTYRDCLKNSIQYLKQVLNVDPKAVHTAITQNHLPSAGGSLLHPHLQINADRVPSNHQRFLIDKSKRYFKAKQSFLFSDYLKHEKNEGSRYIGNTGDWEWLTAFAPEGFFELWAILPGVTSLQELNDDHLMDLSTGIINTQKLYRHLKRNGYNLGVLCVEDPSRCLELRVVMMVRSNYAAWVRNDHTGFEVMLGDMATFTPPEKTAAMARPIWTAPQGCNTG